MCTKVELVTLDLATIAIDISLVAHRVDLSDLYHEEITKCSSSCCLYNQTCPKSRKNELKEIDNNGHFEENSDTIEPVEIIREELEVVENPTTETFPLSSTESQHDEEDQQKEIKTDNFNRYNEDIYEQVKAQSIQLSSLAEMVESLQSQVQQLQETTRLRKPHKTISVRKKSTSNNGTKTKRKSRRGSARSRKK